ncbi:hypothetical protein BCR42DRAFT_397270 [Absidia repens]|uniref:Uncharacterized protein n=1 Tax=Absidia repens TaxID=90262 RepID=A0A1X2I1I9_9FUNG|nr:hypothetical protein BCR42DRAFT_397270 [Absidia repens]
MLTYMAMPIFFFLWAAIVTAQDSGAIEDVIIIYKPTTADEFRPALPAFCQFGECIPARSPRSGEMAREGGTVVPAICVQYEYEDCKGKVLDQKFELKNHDTPISINYDIAKSFVCIPKLQR